MGSEFLNPEDPDLARNEKRRKMIRWGIIGGIILVALILIIVLIVVLTKKSNPTP